MSFMILAQQVVDLSPDPHAIPGGDAIAHLTRGLVFLALLACGAGLTLGAGLWGFGSISTNPYNVMNGKRAVVVSLLAAALIGASSLLISKFFGIGQGIH